MGKAQHTKGKTDAQKARLFSKLVRFITIEAKKSKGDRNAPGACAVEKAKAANMPATTSSAHSAKHPTTLPRWSRLPTKPTPGGTALVIEGYTDNRNRTVQEIKHLLSSTAARLPTPARLCGRLLKSRRQI